MKIHGLVVTSLSTLLLAGCGMHRARVKSVSLSGAGTYVVSTPGALTIARQSGSAWRACTLRTGGPAMHKRGKRHAGPPPRAAGGGPGATLDVLLFRLCEARANNDISAEQYASGVQTILKIMTDMAERRPPPPGPGMWGRGNAQGPARWFHEWMKHEHGDHEHGDHDADHEHHEGRGGPEAHPGPQGGPPHAPPPHKSEKRPKHH